MERRVVAKRRNQVGITENDRKQTFNWTKVNNLWLNMFEYLLQKQYYTLIKIKSTSLYCLRGYTALICLFSYNPLLVGFTPIYVISDYHHHRWWHQHNQPWWDVLYTVTSTQPTMVRCTLYNMWSRLSMTYRMLVTLTVCSGFLYQ